MTLSVDAAEALARADAKQLAGDLEGAIRLYGELLERSPGAWLAFANRGLAYAVLGNAVAARADFRRTLAIEPCCGPALRNLADSLQNDGPQAALLARALTAVLPMLAESWLSLGGAELARRRHPHAARALRRALCLGPEIAEGLMGLGIASDGSAWLARATAASLAPTPLLAAARHANARGDRPRAVRLLRRMLSLAPDSIEALVELTTALDGFEAAEMLHRWGHRALCFAPDSAAVLNNLGTATMALGRMAEAERRFAEAIRLRPDYPESHFNRATPLFLLGREEEAWSEYEWRWRIDRFEKPPSAAPRWSGEDLAGRRLLVHEEQGLGDTIQFVRYLPILKERHRDFVFLCHPRLEGLLRRAFPGLAIVAKPTVPAHDVAAPLLSLPSLLRRVGQAPPAPYLSRPKALPIEAQGRLRVGLVWSGNPQHLRNRDRSVPLPRLRSWFEMPGVAWFSMLFGPGTEEIAGGGFESRIADLGSGLPDLADVAAALAGLDLLITVDTAFGHLAGALGLPVWTLLAWVPDWRWGLAESTTQWYPSMRLFRQPRRGEWQPVIDEVRQALAAFERP
jgi:tetratricopeptide (TPR) repeat protein